MTNRKSTTYNEIIGITESNEIIILEDIFEYEDGFKGATYNLMGVLTPEQITEANDPEHIYAEYDWLWQEAVQAGHTELGKKEFLDEFLENRKYDGYYTMSDDPSYRYETDEALEKLTKEQRAEFDNIFGVRGIAWVDFDCYGGGRVGDSYQKWEFKALFRPDLINEIAKVEKA